jgi:hypothetical protein
LDQHLAAHAEVGEQGVAAVEGKPEVLPTTAGGDDAATSERGDETSRTARVTAYRTRMEHLDGGDGASDDMPFEAGPDHLDLGKLGQRLSR